MFGDQAAWYDWEFESLRSGVGSVDQKLKAQAFFQAYLSYDCYKHMERALKTAEGIGKRKTRWNLKNEQLKIH